ncbi:MAG: MotA/TolQ/ExbB proton channel family protein [Phycisphaerae bacterium]|nr:MotA/TolQ/ExbB proton channel family protein [Phycisphaerae bacterium]
MQSIPSAAPAATPGGGAGSAGMSILDLFWESKDPFTLVLVLGSVVAVAIIIRCVFEIRAARILPSSTEGALRRMLREGRHDELRALIQRDETFVPRVLRAALAAGDDKGARREAAELAASEECANWFRRIEPLNVIGNLGPLIGLAGTVYGMILAFTALGQSGGQANPAVLSLGISKALFHTLLGLLLALPALAVFGFYRSIVDRLCTRAMVVSAELVERLPTEAK